MQGGVALIQLANRRFVEVEARDLKMLRTTRSRDAAQMPRTVILSCKAIKTLHSRAQRDSMTTPTGSNNSAQDCPSQARATLGATTFNPSLSRAARRARRVSSPSDEPASFFTKIFPPGRSAHNVKPAPQAISDSQLNTEPSGERFLQWLFSAAIPKI